MSGRSPSPLEQLFAPRSVAVVGASRTPGKMGHDTVRALVESPFRGAVYPVNRDGGEILGCRAYPDLAATPDVPDLAIVVVPAGDVIPALAAAAARGVAVAQVLSSGFAEVGDDGRAAELAIAELSAASGMRVVGPNCVGTFSARAGLSWTTRASFEPGGVSFVSQSGGLAYDVLLRGAEQGLGFDKVVSVGNCVDVQVAEFLRHLAAEPDTTTVGLYVEGVRDGRDLMAAMRTVVAAKSLVVLKGGRSDEGGRTVGSHTGRLAGDYRLWRAALRQVGALEVRSMESMIAALAALAARPSGLRADGVALLGNGGGATVLAVDRCAELGLRLASCGPDALARLRQLVPFDGVLPPSGTPLDLPLGRLLAGRGALCADVLAAYCAEPSVGAVVVHLNLVPLGEWADQQGVVDDWVDHLAGVDAAGVAVVPVLRTDGSAALDALRRRIARRLEAVFSGPTFDRVDEALEAVVALASVGGLR